MQPWLVAVGAGRWQLSGIMAAQRDGISVMALDADPNAPGFLLADRRAVVDIRNPDAVLECVRREDIRPSGAIAFATEAGMLAAAALREVYDLTGPRSEVALCLTNKHMQRRRWTDAGLPCPKWVCIETSAAAEQAIKAMDGAVIFKPSDSAGSRGVTVVNPSEDWRPAFEVARKNSSIGKVMIETFIRGTEFTVETFAHKGRTSVLAVSEKRKVLGSRDTVADELATSRLPTAVTVEIGALALRALEVLVHKDGPGHTEIIRKEDGSLWLVETAGRGGGFMVADGIVPRTSGFDLARASALQAVGREPPPSDNLKRKAFVLRFIPSRRGVVVSMSGLDEARSIGNVDCGFLVSTGDCVEDARTDGARLAYILSWADHVDEAFRLADRAEKSLHIEIVPLPC
jgi:biotin carboxylase